MRRFLILLLLASGAFCTVKAQRKPIESSLVLGYEKYKMGFVNLGYTAFVEHESMYHFTRHTRFEATTLLNPMQHLYGLQIGGSYSYLVAAGLNVNIIRNLQGLGTYLTTKDEVEKENAKFNLRRYIVNVNPKIGVDFWFGAIYVGYNLHLNLNTFNAPDPPVVGRFNLTFNAYIPLKKNTKMYRS